MEKALELDPLSLTLLNWYGHVLLVARDLAGAVKGDVVCDGRFGGRRCRVVAAAGGEQDDRRAANNAVGYHAYAGVA